ncbi:hypothetical protein BGZ76_003926 [Entomortierella beljakovae]|nr:hypothetical protein BGZ76_003926 [Entomortierella beljakovae]
MKQRPTHLTRAEVDTTGTMTLPDQQHSQLSQRQSQQHLPSLGAPPTLKDIEAKHSQLPPQYRQAVLEQQQREHQQRVLQQQQQGSPRIDPQRQQSASVSSSPNGNGVRKGSVNSTHQRISSAPLLNSYRTDRVNTYTTNQNPGPGRAHWKPDSSAQVCTWPGCLREFGFFDRRHHCRRCGDIFCSAHCSKAVPLDYALDFNPAMGILSRACTGCYEAYEQWQGLAPSTHFSGQQGLRGIFGFVSDSQIAGEYITSPVNKQAGSMTLTAGMKEGLLSNSNTPIGLSGETLGREDIVRIPKSASENIAIKPQPKQDTTIMPMPSVPHDWSWSTF